MKRTPSDVFCCYLSINLLNHPLKHGETAITNYRCISMKLVLRWSSSFAPKAKTLALAERRSSYVFPPINTAFSLTPCPHEHRTSRNRRACARWSARRQRSQPQWIKGHPLACLITKLTVAWRVPSTNNCTTQSTYYFR